LCNGTIYLKLISNVVLNIYEFRMLKIDLVLGNVGKFCLVCRVSDPYTLNTDLDPIPDPEFSKYIYFGSSSGTWILILIHIFSVNFRSDQNLLFFPWEEMFFKICEFLLNICYFWRKFKAIYNNRIQIQICMPNTDPDPDSDTQWIWIQSGSSSGSETL
jgi:hypothetical protein